MRRRWRRVLAWIALAPLALACTPLDAWNPVVPAAAHGSGDYAPCTYVFPYFHGYDEAGAARCTVRPPDMTSADVDALTVP